VLLAVGAGHAFKFATQIGRILTELALDGATAHDIALFRADRSVLSDFDAPRTWND
jgi:sarcosine oxidase